MDGMDVWNAQSKHRELKLWGCVYCMTEASVKKKCFENMLKYKGVKNKAKLYRDVRDSLAQCASSFA